MSEPAAKQGGISDGLLLGILAFLLAVTVLIWTATGLAALFAHGAWPPQLTFLRTPLAMRHLISSPQDVAGAWPDTPANTLSGYGLFWGLFIGQLMILFTLAVFGMNTWVRWRVVRARRKQEKPSATAPVVIAEPPATEVPPQRAPELPRQEQALPPEPAATEALPALVGLRTEPREHRRTTATAALQEAPGAALVVTSDPDLWRTTKDARAKLGPVLLYDPTHLCDSPARLHWHPTTGCEDKQTAAARATALLAPTRPTAKIDQAVTDTAETLLRSCLHAAALDGRTIRHVHRWAQGTQIQDAVRTLRTHPKAAPGAAGELEAALTGYPERRDIAQELIARTLSALSTVNVREACAPNRTDALTLDSFIHEGGTLYVVGESIEDPRANPGAMPFLTALAASVVERGRRMAERSSSGRLDPPITLILDDVAAVAPLPDLPALLASGSELGLPTLALVRSREQARARWPYDDLKV